MDKSIKKSKHSSMDSYLFDLANRHLFLRSSYQESQDKIYN